MKMKMNWAIPMIIWMVGIVMSGVYSEDLNLVYSPCADAKVHRHDGFTFGLVFSSKEAFFYNQTQLSPCDRRLVLAGGGKLAALALFRPKVDEISVLTVDTNSFSPSHYGGYMVAFAGRQYAARSIPVFVADNAHTVTSLTLVLEFKNGILQNLFWKKFGCSSCTGGSLVCLNGTDCAVPNSKCNSTGGAGGCNIGIQVAFSGTDMNYNVMNSWYEVAKLRQYSLFALFSDLRDSLTGF